MNPPGHEGILILAYRSYNRLKAAERLPGVDDNGNPARFQDTGGLHEELIQVRDMLHGVQGIDLVEAVVGEVQIGGITVLYLVGNRVIQGVIADIAMHKVDDRARINEKLKKITSLEVSLVSTETAHKKKPSIDEIIEEMEAEMERLG